MVSFKGQGLHGVPAAGDVMRAEERIVEGFFGGTIMIEPSAVWMAVTPVRTFSPWIRVVWPTLTPATSVMAFSGPDGSTPTLIPRPRARGRGSFWPTANEQSMVNASAADSFFTDHPKVELPSAWWEPSPEDGLVQGAKVCANFGDGKVPHLGAPLRVHRLGQTEDA